jgi:ABC-type multidrug transport system permease subunit
MKQLSQLILLQLREFYREPGILFWAFGFPILMAWGLGIAFTSKADQSRNIAWVQESKSVSTIEPFLANSNDKKIGNEKSGFTTYHFQKSTWNEAIEKIKQGKVSLVVVDKGDSTIYHFDPKNAEAQMAYVQINAAIKNIKNDGSDIQTFDEVGTRYIDFLLPGLLALNIMMACMWGISYSLIDRRSKKLLRRMIATPMNKTIFLTSHLVTRIIISFAEALLLLSFATLYFDIEIQGSILALIAMIIAGNIIFFGLAVLASSRTSNTQIGNGLINAVVMPMMITSGIFFSYHNFPEWLVPVIKYFPLTSLADNIRSVFIEGAGIMDVMPAFLTLSGIGAVLYLIALKVYKWY